jgi:4-diphosphocytidyl-2-C-methyl-D-erythritol kinase
MLVFPHCKINLGLNVTEKRADGFHSLETVFYPVKWCDALEVIEAPGGPPFTLSSSGAEIAGNMEDNLLFKAWKLVSMAKSLPPLKVHLHKNIPMGAGVGGGSSDGAFFIELLDNKFDLKLPYSEKHRMASELGSDCAFFLENKARYATGRGNEFSDIQLDLSSYFILLIHPGIHSNTSEAFAGLVPKKPQRSLKDDIANYPPEQWKDKVFNDFDQTIFKKYPLIGELKEQMYRSGALYASMSGSGSCVYGIFSERPAMTIAPTFKYYLQLPHS